MRKPAQTEHSIHDLLKERWSPRAFDDRSIPDATLWSLFEAARWSPSASNAQPWAFIVVRRGDVVHDKIAAGLSRNNQRWAPHAPVLIVAVAKLERDDGRPNRHAYYDLGQAVAHLTVQATASGLHVRQMGGFDIERVREACAIPEGYEPVTLMAVGYVGALERLPDDLRERESHDRTRKPLSEFVFSDVFGEPMRTAERAAR